MTLSNKELYEVRIPCVSSRWVGPDITMADPYLPSLPHMIVMYGGTPLSTSENASAIQKLRLKGHSTIFKVNQLNMIETQKITCTLN